MENRVAVLAVIAEDFSSAEQINSILHEYRQYIIGRMGVPYRDKGVNIISVAVDAPEEKILKTSEELFAYYFPELNRDDYEIEYQGEADAMPAWIVEYTRTTEGIIDSKIRMTFDACGELHMIIATENIKEGRISKKQAVEIALNELRSDKYDIPEFDRNDIQIEIAAKNDKSCYTVSVSGIPSNDKYITAYAFFTIDYNNGNIIDSEVIC